MRSVAQDEELEAVGFDEDIKAAVGWDSPDTGTMDCVAAAREVSGKIVAKADAEPVGTPPVAIAAADDCEPGPAGETSQEPEEHIDPVPEADAPADD